MYTVTRTVSCTWPTISGMPRARSISCRAMTSAVLSRESSWSRSARSSLGPSLLARGPRSSSRGCPNCSLTQQMTQEMVSHFYYFCTLLMQRSEEKLTAITDTSMSACEFRSSQLREARELGPVQRVYLFVLVLGLSIPMAESGQEGD